MGNALIDCFGEKHIYALKRFVFGPHINIYRWGGL